MFFHISSFTRSFTHLVLFDKVEVIYWWGVMVVRCIVLLLMVMPLLTGCFYDKDAKALMKDKDVRDDIEQTIVGLVWDEYGLDVDVKMKEWAFTYPEGKLMLPLKTSKRLEVPVHVLGEPPFDFKAYISIYDAENDTYVFHGDKDEINVRELHVFGDRLMGHIFREMYGDVLAEMQEIDKDVQVKARADHAFFGGGFVDEEELPDLMAQFAHDYREGKFADETYYEEMYATYVEKPVEGLWRRYEELIAGEYPCTARIHVDVVHEGKDDGTIESWLRRLVDFIESHNQMPNGSYFVDVEDGSTDKEFEKESKGDVLLICR